MKKLIIKYFKFDLMKYKLGRKYIGGTFYFIQTGLPMAPFWYDEIITSCQSYVIRTEKYAN